MNLVGEKVILRALEAGDGRFLLDLINDPSIEYMLGGWSFPVSPEAQQKWLDNLLNDKNTLRCVVCGSNDYKAVGVVMLTDIDWKNGNAEIHIKLDKEAGGKGYGTDAIRTMVGYAFNELRLHLIYANVNSFNIVSQKLFEKCGFWRDGVLRQRIYKKGKFEDVVAFSIINEIEEA